MLKFILIIPFFACATNANLFSSAPTTNSVSEVHQLRTALIQIAHALGNTTNKLPPDVRELLLLFTSQLKTLLDGTVDNLKPFHHAIDRLLTESDKLLDNAPIRPLRQALYQLKDDIFRLILAMTKNAADTSLRANEKIKTEIWQALQLFVKNLQPTILTFSDEYQDLKVLVRTMFDSSTNTKRMLICLASLLLMFALSCYLFYRYRSQLSVTRENPNFYAVLWTIGMIMPCLVGSLTIIIFNHSYESFLAGLIVFAICIFLILSSVINFVVFAGKYRFFSGPLVVLSLCLIPFIVRDSSFLCNTIISFYRHQGDHSYHYLFPTSNWIEDTCSNLNEGLCPLVDLKLIEREENDDLILVDATLQLLRTLPSPLFIHSEIGDSDTGKSLRQTILTRLIIKSKYRRMCANQGIQFFVRDTKANRLHGIHGVTRGISIMIIPSIWIDYEQIPKELKQSMSQLQQGNGTLLVIDMEGGNEYGGATMTTMRTLQLLAIGISSHVSIATKEHINNINMKEMATYALLINMLKTASNTQCGVQQTLDPLEKPSLFALPSISVLPKKTDNLVPFIRGIQYARNDDDNVFVTQLGDEHSDEGEPNIDLTHIFWANLTKLKESDLKSDVEAIRLHFKNIRYLVNFTPYPSRSGLFSYPNEFSIYKNSKSIDLAERWNRFDDWRGYKFLPERFKPPFGLTYSLAHYVFPAMFARMPAKQIANKLASGVELVGLIKDLFRLLKVFHPSWLESLGAAQMQQNVCNSVQSIVKAWEENLKDFQDSFPIEGNPPCQSKELCKPEFEQNWKELVAGLERSLCMFQQLAGSSEWDECRRNHVDFVIRTKYNNLAYQNEEDCSYRWKTGEYGEECSPKTCPGYRHRPVYCVIAKTDEKRPDDCCSIYLPNKQKPLSQESCDKWTYRWNSSEWGSCSKPACGNRDRYVKCKRCDESISNDDECLQSELKPATTETCNPTYEWKSKEPSSCPCDTHQQRTVWCEKCGRTDNGVTQNDCKEHAFNTRPSDQVQCSVCPPPSDSSSCFSGETLITMHDHSEKPIKQVIAGEYILTPTYRMVNDRLTFIPQMHSIARVAFVEQRKLGHRSLYGINNLQPFFTSEHIFLTSHGQAVAISPMDMFIEDPSWSIDDVQPMTINETILFHLHDNEVMLQNSTSISYHSVNSDVVYTLILDSVHQFYANGFVVSDLFPQLHKYPFTFILFHWLWRDRSMDINRYLHESFPKHLQSFATDDIHLYPNINMFRTKLLTLIDEFISNQTHFIK